jgi:drug/metabolite transporter (DMT)-like permease
VHSPHARSGLLFALGGFALLSCGDAIIKSIAGAWPGTAVAALRYSFAAGGLATFLFLKEGQAGFAFPRLDIQLLRGAAVAAATMLFFSSIFLMPLAEATAIGFTTPMITALLSAVFLKERTRPSTWIASIAAFSGVLIILRPNVAEMGIVALMPLAAAACMAVMMMGNRVVATAGSPLLMQFLASSVAVPFVVGAAIIGHYSGFEPLKVGPPDWTIIAKCAIVAVSATMAHILIFMGTMRASAAEIAPMTYVQLLIAMALGIALFGDWPDLMSLAGSAIIIGAGLFLWHQKPV